MSNSRLPQARLQALRALDGLGALTEPMLLKALRDTDERVREHAVALSQRMVDRGKISDPLWGRLSSLSADPSMRVRYQLAFTLGEINRPERVKTMVEVLQRDATNCWLQPAILSSLSSGAGDLLVALAADPRWRNDAAGRNFLSQLALMIGVKGQLDEVAQGLAFLNRALLDSQTAFILLYALGEGLHRTGSSLALVDPKSQLQGFYDRALQAALDTTAIDPLRIAALRLLGVSPYATSARGDIFQLLFGTGQSEAVQFAAVATLERYENPAIAGNLIMRWPELAPVVRRQVIAALLARTDRVGALMTALEQGRISPAEFSSSQADFLRNYRDRAISQRALRIFGEASRPRTAVVEQFKTALRVTGIPARGRETFRQRCASCHRLGGEGRPLGPDLATAKIAGKGKMLRAILQPNLEVARGFGASVVETRHRENLLGIITDENETTITLREADGVEMVWPRLNIQSIQPQPWSLMPAGLEQGLTVQNMADLLEYIMTALR
ncbi:MAG: hypothetical protein DME26_04575 [Verrucomicrobia bacterium]|nr:MAG: hypothetical protein DME26_04575 [Verrucomicrobiota bacterium]